jgi:hypothetical protein
MIVPAGAVLTVQHGIWLAPDGARIEKKQLVGECTAANPIYRQTINLRIDRA